MPTESLNRLIVQGDPTLLSAFRNDREVWDVDPWSALFGARLEHDGPSWLVYRYEEDGKRPAPDPADIASRHPALRFVHEVCDEFGGVAVRSQYASGRQVERARVDATDLDWIEWDAED